MKNTINRQKEKHFYYSFLLGESLLLCYHFSSFSFQFFIMTLVCFVDSRISDFVYLKEKRENKQIFTVMDKMSCRVFPKRETEYERFITSAYPYYISSFSMMAGAFLLSFIVLYHRDDIPKKKAE